MAAAVVQATLPTWEGFQAGGSTCALRLVAFGCNLELSRVGHWAICPLCACDIKNCWCCRGYSRPCLTPQHTVWCCAMLHSCRLRSIDRRSWPRKQPGRQHTPQEGQQQPQQQQQVAVVAVMWRTMEESQVGGAYGAGHGRQSARLVSKAGYGPADGDQQRVGWHPAPPHPPTTRHVMDLVAGGVMCTGGGASTTGRGPADSVEKIVGLHPEPTTCASSKSGRLCCVCVVGSQVLVVPARQVVAPLVVVRRRVSRSLTHARKSWQSQQQQQQQHLQR
jgi:hypothetical protein